MKRGFCLLTLCLLSLVNISWAQEVDTTNNTGGQKYIVDEVVAVVGSSMILLSELNSTAAMLNMQYKQQGITPKIDLKAEALENLMLKKFLASQAAIDSLPVDEASVSRETDSQMKLLIEQYGSTQNLEKHYNKPIFTIRDIIIRRTVMEQNLAQAMQSKAQSGVTITPSEVARYIKKIDSDSLPIVPEQYVYAQIVKLPKLTDNARMDIKEKLINLRKRIMEGANFSAMARMYSDDASSAIRGGELNPQPLAGFVGPFAEALEKLKPGQVSEVVETEFGFHILEMLSRKGDNYTCRHILLQLKFAPDELTKAQQELDSIATEIKDGRLLFKDACEKFSDDEKSNKNEGIVINTQYENYGGARTKTTKFFKEELRSNFDKLKNLEEGQISESFTTIDETKGIEVVKLVKLIDIIPAHTASIRDDYDTLEQMAKNIKQGEKFNEWIENKVAAMYIRIEEPYRSLNFKNKIWLK